MLKNHSRQRFLALFFGFCCLFLNNLLLEAIEDEFSPKCFIRNPFNSMSLSHTEGKGLGYSQGYNSLDLFLTYPLYNNEIIPLLDLRGHLFNDGKSAANLGLGLRWFNSCYNNVWGINAFYDSLRTHHRSYSQVSLGLESLSATWDIRINGYLPVGHKTTPIYRLSYDFTSGFLAKAREQFSMGGIDAEVGYHFLPKQCIDIYASIGPYAYWGRSQKTENAFRNTRRDFFGGRLRAWIGFWTYCKLEGVTSYDSRFKWIGQVTFSLNISFDHICSAWNQTTCYNPYCYTLTERLYQPIIRNEIIVVDRINRFSSNPAILDPEFEP